MVDLPPVVFFLCDWFTAVVSWFIRHAGWVIVALGAVIVVLVIWAWCSTMLVPPSFP